MNKADQDRLVAVLVEAELAATAAQAAVRGLDREDERKRRTEADVAVWVDELVEKTGRVKAVAATVLGTQA